MIYKSFLTVTVFVVCSLVMSARSIAQDAPAAEDTADLHVDPGKLNVPGIDVADGEFDYYTGEYRIVRKDMVVPTDAGFDLVVARTYSSDLQTSIYSSMGAGWNLEPQLT